MKIHSLIVVAWAITASALTLNNLQPELGISKCNGTSNNLKRSLLSCAQPELDVTREEEAIFKTYFCRSDLAFFQMYSEKYFESIYLEANSILTIEGGIEEKLQVLKIILRALNKVAKAVKSIDFISVAPEKRAKQHEVIHAANYILTMWNRLFSNLERGDREAYQRCFLDRDVPYRSLSDFNDKFDAFRAKLILIESSFN